MALPISWWRSLATNVICQTPGEPLRNGKHLVQAYCNPKRWPVSNFFSILKKKVFFEICYFCETVNPHLCVGYFSQSHNIFPVVSKDIKVLTNRKVVTVSRKSLCFGRAKFRLNAKESPPHVHVHMHTSGEVFLNQIIWRAFMNISIISCRF